MAAELFLKTSYAIALAATTDQHHARAVELASRVDRERTRLFTSRAMVLEIGNALSRRRYRATAVALFDAPDPQGNRSMIEGQFHETVFRCSFRS